MQVHHATTVIPWCALGGVILALPSLAWPAHAAPQAVVPPSPPDVVYITGKVRDFRAENADFNVTISAGNGHYAGNVAMALDGEDRPAFSGAGYKVGTEWRNQVGYAIPPHLAIEPRVVKLASTPSTDSGVVLDTWDSTMGAYGPGNRGPSPSIQTGSNMPTIEEPTGMGPSVGYSFHEGVVTLSSDIHCDTWECKKLTSITVTGDVTIFCEDDFIMNQGSVITLAPGAMLRLYVRDQIRISQSSQVNMNTFDPSRLLIYNLGTSSVEINQGNQVCATVYSPNAPMHLAQGDHFYGSFIGESLDVDQSSGFHHDIRPAYVCGTLIDDDSGAASAISDGGLVSADRFAEWYSDVLDINMHTNHTIALRRNSSGVYEYSDDAFFPIDGRLYGNQNMSHNYYFTFTFTIEFVHSACSGSFFEFRGADDAWMFIDGQLAMDLGGILPGTGQYVEIDRLDLVDGETYRINFFYAQRNPVDAIFRVRTNLDLIIDNNTVSASPDFD